MQSIIIYITYILKDDCIMTSYSKFIHYSKIPIHRRYGLNLIDKMGRAWDFNYMGHLHFRFPRWMFYSLDFNK